MQAAPVTSRPPRSGNAQPNLSSEELAWVGSVAERYDALVFHWVGPLTGGPDFDRKQVANVSLMYDIPRVRSARVAS